MAMSLFLEEELIICNLCKNQALRFCKTCQLNLCENCVINHVDRFESLIHDIVLITNNTLLLVFLECDRHPDRKCESYCNDCQSPVCTKCLIGPHKSHDVEELDSFVESKKQEIKEETDLLEDKILPNFQTRDADIQFKITEATTKYDELKQENKRLRILWHKEVDAIFDSFGVLIYSMIQNDLRPLMKSQKDIEYTIQDMLQTIQQNKELLKSSKASEVRNYKSRLKEYSELQTDTEIKVTSPSLLVDTSQGRELSIEMGEIKAKLTRTPFLKSPADAFYLASKNLLKKARVIATIPTNHHPIDRICCVKTEEAWISGDKSLDITRLDIHGSVLDTISRKTNWPLRDMASTKKRKLIYSDKQTVKIVKRTRTESLITPSQGWIPKGLCCTRSGEILVHVNRGKSNKITKYRGETIIQEFDEEIDGSQIFTDGDNMLYICESNNRDICVTDSNADTVVVMDRIGRVRFRYNGRASKTSKSFSPRYIVTDALSHIIITDYGNDCLHILDQNGYFLKYLDNCGIEKPNGLSVDSVGRLWVGLNRTGVVKVIEYMK